MLIAETGDIFYPLGIALTILALVLGFGGLRFKDFPKSRAQLFIGLGVIVALVAATTTYAVVLSKHEKETRENEEAAKIAEGPDSEDVDNPKASEEDQEALEAADVEEGDTGSSETVPSGGETLPLSSPTSGNLVYDTSKLTGKAGKVTIDYTNPSPVPHSVAIEDSSGKELGEGDTVSNGEQSIATADLQPGTYTFFCTVPGHREQGMEGTLTIK